MKQQLKNSCSISKVFLFLENRVTIGHVILFLTLFIFNTQGVIAQNNEDGNGQFHHFKKQDKWSYTVQVGWATNIDFTVKSTSQDYRFDDYSTGINARFYSYDSREKTSQLEGDQANNYLLTIRNHSSEFTITTGIIHDKKQQLRNTHNDRFKYEKGGMSPVLLLGLQHNFSSDFLRNLSIQFKAGGFLSFNKIDAALINNNSNTKYKANNRNRTYAGGGAISMVVVSYEYYITEAVSISFLVNGTMMSGKAVTKAKAFNENTEEGREGKLSVSYSSVSVGPSIGLTFVR
ncbi:MAG: hypothetical protein ACJAZ2_001198 [Glaciecola sp.]|jgi:hypothetical protein